MNALRYLLVLVTVFIQIRARCEEDENPIIFHHVNTITGDLNLAIPETVIEGAVPLEVQRTYCSAGALERDKTGNDLYLKNLHHGFLIQGGWSFFSHAYLLFIPGQIDHATMAHVADRTGSITTYEYVKTEERWIVLQPRGCNAKTYGKISSKSNPLLNVLKVDSTTGEAHLTLADGGACFYQGPNRKERKKKNDYGIAFFYLQKEHLPSGQHIAYAYDRKDRLYGVKMMNPKESKTFSSLTFSLDKPRTPYRFSLSTSDNKNFEYQFKDIDQRDYLVDVKSSCGMKQNFDYTKDRKGIGARVRQIHLDGDVQYRISYYKMSEKEKHNRERKPKPLHVDKVEKIEAPYGKNKEFIPIATFFYEKGVTKVQDAEGLWTHFFHEEGKPQLIVYHDENGTPSSYMKFLWNHDLMVAKIKLDKNKSPIFSKTFFYDECGNVIKETFWGNITKQTTTPFLEGPWGSLINAEHISKSFSYDKETHYLIEEREDSGLVYQYSYKDSTSNINKKLTRCDDKIILREFWEFDDDYLLTTKIIDDGTKEDGYDLSGVTERKITRYTRDAETGDIVTIQEMYVDLSLGQERLIQKKEFLYGPEKKPILESVYDDKGSFKYSIKSKYDRRGNLIEQTNALGSRDIFRYDNKGRIIFSQKAGELSKEFFFDTAGRLVREDEIDHHGGRRTTTMEYDCKGRLIKKTDPLGHTILQDYNCFGQCLSSETEPLVAQDGSMSPSIISFTYDVAGNLCSVRNPQGATTSTCYNSLRNPISIQEADGSVTEHRYDTSGNKVMTIHPDGTREVFSYDPFKRMTSKEIFGWDDELLQEEKWTYSTFHLTSHTNAEGLTTHYFYDGAGRLVREEAESRVKRYEYDSLGHRSRSYDDDICYVEIHNVQGQLTEAWIESPFFAKENWTGYIYDEHGRKILAHRISANSLTKDFFVYDERNRLIRHTNPLGQTWHFSYDEDKRDAAGHKVCRKITKDPMGYQLIETYDVQGRIFMRQREDAEGVPCSKEEMYYDCAGNKKEHISYVFLNGQLQKKHTLRWHYDICSRVIEEIEADEKRTQYSYDCRGRVVKKRLNSEQEVHFCYDGLGRITRQFSLSGSVDYSYHYFKGEKPIYAIDEVSHYSIERNYNLFGDLIREISSDGTLYQWRYDNLGRCIQFTLPDTSQILYKYRGQHMTCVKRIGADGKYYEHNYITFDSNGHVDEEKMIFGLGYQSSQRDVLERLVACSSSLHSCTASYDSIGRIIHKQDSLHGDRSYQYDPLGQIRQENENTYAFDSLGNPAGAAIGPCNELLGGFSYEMRYDSDGRMVERKEDHSCHNFYYDSLDRLVKIEHSDGSEVIFCYDALGRLAKKIEEGLQTVYLFDRDLEIGSMTQEGLISELKVLGLGVKADLGASVAIEIQNKPYLPLHDISGNIIAIVSEDGTLQEQYRYDVFGKEQEQQKCYINPWRYFSKRHESSLIFFGLRFYDPHIGRWLTPDPSGYTDGANLYVFVMNAPSNRLDLFGLLSEPLYPFPDLKMEAPLHVLLNSPTFSDVHTFKGCVDGVEVDWLIKGGNWSKLNFSSEELSCGKVNLFHHFHEVLPSEGKMIGLISFQNGIRTSLADASEMVHKVSLWSPDDTLIVSLYNPSNSLLGDVTGAGLEIWQWKETQITALTRQYFTAMTTTLCKINPEAFWLHIAHSRGGGIATRAIEGMSEEQREAMKKNFLYLGVAPSIPMPRGFCSDAMNIYSEMDHITGRFGRKLINHPDYNIEVVKCITPFHERPFTSLFADHAFLGRTYQDRTQDVIRKLGKIINEQQGINR